MRNEGGKHPQRQPQGAKQARVPGARTHTHRVPGARKHSHWDRQSGRREKRVLPSELKFGMLWGHRRQDFKKSVFQNVHLQRESRGLLQRSYPTSLHHGRAREGPLGPPPIPVPMENLESSRQGGGDLGRGCARTTGGHQGGGPGPHSLASSSTKTRSRPTCTRDPPSEGPCRPPAPTPALGFSCRRFLRPAGPPPWPGGRARGFDPLRAALLGRPQRDRDAPSAPVVLRRRPSPGGARTHQPVSPLRPPSRGGPSGKHRVSRALPE